MKPYYVLLAMLMPWLSFGQGISIHFPYSTVYACQDSSYTVNWTGGGVNELIDIYVIDLQSWTVDYAVAWHIPNTGSYTSAFTLGPYGTGSKQIYVQTSTQTTWSYGTIFNLKQCCSNNLIVSPQIDSSPIGGNVSFNASTSDPNPSYIWQSDFGQGFQTLNNYGNYSGVGTSSLTITNMQFANHNQPIRVISTAGTCIDTSNVAVINILDTCTVMVYLAYDEFEVPGCTYSFACNYNPTATRDDGSCDLPEPYYDCAGNCLLDLNGNGLCDLEEVPGCSIPEALNYNPEASLDDGSCLFQCPGDLNNDAQLNTSDLLVFLTVYGESCP
jgi:hypothetical protein